MRSQSVPLYRQSDGIRTRKLVPLAGLVTRASSLPAGGLDHTYRGESLPLEYAKLELLPLLRRGVPKGRLSKGLPSNIHYRQ